jgi:hypothetical protein
VDKSGFQSGERRGTCGVFSGPLVSTLRRDADVGKGTKVFISHLDVSSRSSYLRSLHL